MTEVLAASLAFPSVVYTVILALALIYWFFVILGALDLDLLGGAGGEGAADIDIDLDGVAKGALEGATKGALEGATKGALEGATKGALEGAIKGTAEGAADGIGGGGEIEVAGGGGGGIGAVFASLQLHRAPATVVLTILAAFGWLTSVLAMMTLEPLWAGWGLARWLLGAPVLLASLVVALPLTSLAVRPLGPLFATRAAKSRKDLVGSVCIVSTGRVDDRFGQATLEDGGAGLLLDVRCDTPDALRRGDRALIVSWDADKEAFCVEALEPLLDSKRGGKGRVAARPAPDAGEGAGGEDEADPGAAAERARGRAG